MYIDRKKVTPEDAKKSFRIATVLIFLVFLAVFFAYWNVQVIRYDYFRNRALQNIIKTVDVDAPRGLIVDRNGNVLAENRINFTLYLIRENIQSLDKTLSVASFLTGKNRSKIEATLKRYEKYPRFYMIPLQSNLSLAKVAYIESREEELQEFQIDLRPHRSYPYGKNASHLLGYVSEISEEELKEKAASEYKMGDIVGVSGLEKQYEALLRGTKGTQTIIKDNLEKIQQVISDVKPRIGQTLVLSIDVQLQKFLEELFIEEKGVAAVVDLEDGGILAMVSKPSFDPDIFTREIDPDLWQELSSREDPPLRNKFIQGTYSPGSVFKIVMALTALQEGIITPATAFFCGGSISIFDHEFHCAKASGHGWLNLYGAIEKSCNIYFYNLGKRLSIDTIAHYAKLLGLGANSGVDLPNEAVGLLPTSDWKLKTTGQKWYAGETISVAIGEGSLDVTPIQMLQMISTIALRGKKIKMHILKRIEKDAETLHVVPLEYERVPIKREFFEEVIEGLHRVVNGEGTGWQAGVEGLDICGKTGTSQIISKQNPNYRTLIKQKRFIPNSWFASFAPRNNPKIAVIVLVENGGDAGLIAAPMSAKIYRKFFVQ